MTIKVKQHYRNVNGKLVLVHEHEHKGNAAQQHELEQHASWDDFDQITAHHFPEPEADYASKTADEFDSILGSYEAQTGNEFDSIVGLDQYQGDDEPEQAAAPEPKKESAPPTAAELEGIGGSPWEKPEKGISRIYFNGLHKLYMEAGGSDAVPYSAFKGAKLWFDNKDGQFHHKGIAEDDFYTIVDHLTKKAKEWGSNNAFTMPDGMTQQEQAVDGPKVGEKVPVGQLKIGMKLKVPDSTTTYTVEDVTDDEVKLVNQFDKHYTVDKDMWNTHTTAVYAGEGTQPKQERSSGTKIGETPKFEQLKPGMVIKKPGATNIVIAASDDTVWAQSLNGVVHEYSKASWEKHAASQGLKYEGMDDGSEKVEISPGLKVGDTKTINGVTYRLNENHRWEKVDGDQLGTKDKLEALVPYGWENTVTINGVSVQRSGASIFRVMKNDENGKPLSKKVKDALAELHPASYLKKKGYFLVSKDDLDKLAAIIDGKAESKPKAKPAPKAAIPSVTTGGTTDIRNWKLIEGQKGSNEGGLYEDETGKKFYVKFPADEAIAKNEVLASKLYQACGIDSPDVNTIMHNGKLGVASEWKDGLKKGSPSALANAEGSKDGFVIDAWLANWDVVGLEYDNMLLDKSGKAVRIDPGGSLLYRAQGGPKGDAFGTTVPELHTLLDEATNGKSASVFGGITRDQLVASASKLLEISDDDIKSMVKAWGPGGTEDRDGLAAKLIARKAYIAKMFPGALPKPKVDIKATPNFKEWNGPGKGLSGKPWVNDQNQELAEKIHDMGKAGDLQALESMKFQPISYNDGTPEGPEQPISAHKSHWITDYWNEVIDKVKNPEITYKKLKADLLSNVKALAGKAHAIVAAFPDVKKLKDCQKRIGRYGVMGAFHENPMEGWAPKELSENNKGVDIQSIYDQSQASYKKLTSTQKQAIKAYTGSEYHSINNPNTGEGTSGMTEHAIKGLAEAAIPLPEGMVLSRKFRFNTDHAKNHEALMGSVNSVLKDFGCISTGTRPDVWGGEYQLRITCAQGVKGLFVDKNPSTGGGAISSHPGERELILPYGTKFLVRKVHHQPFKDEHGHWGGVEKGITIDVVALPNDDLEQ